MSTIAALTLTGFVLSSPLPDERWLIFVNRDEADSAAEAEGR